MLKFSLYQAQEERTCRSNVKIKYQLLMLLKCFFLLCCLCLNSTLLAMTSDINKNSKPETSRETSQDPDPDPDLEKETDNSKIKIKLQGYDNKLEKKQLLDHEIKKNILTTVSLEKQKDNPRLTDSQVKKLHKKAPQEIKIALQALGYYQPTIRSDLVAQDRTWRATYTIDPGPPLLVKNLDIKIIGEASTDQNFQQLREKLSLQQGDIFHHGQYEATKKELQRLAASRGYFDAKLNQHNAEVDLASYSAQVLISLDSGPRYRFGQVSFVNSPIELDKIRQYVKFKPGDPYTNQQLVELQQDLFNSDYFAQIDVRPMHDKIQQLEIPIEVDLTPKKQDLYTGGVGFGTDTGPRLKLGWNHRFTRKGHRLGANARISPRLSSLNGFYNIAHLFERNDQLSFTSDLSSEDIDTSKSDSVKLGSNYRHKRWGWKETISLNYLFENFEIASQTQTSQLLIPGIGWSLTESDGDTYTKNGYRLGLSLQAASDSVLSDVSFIQLGLNGKYIRSLGQRGRFISRGEIGITEVSDFARLPSSLRYYAGGDRSIRGFDYKGLGPKDEQGNIIGGRYLMVASLEYEHRILEKWAIAAFVDAGNSFNNFGDDIEYGTGFGLRWLSPVGQVRVDLAMGISADDKPIRLHIIIGPDL